MVDLAGFILYLNGPKKKYLVPDEKFAPLAEAMRTYMTEDEYGQYTICNIYYDTDSDELIRRRLAKPKYKEKYGCAATACRRKTLSSFSRLKKR